MENKKKNEPAFERLLGGIKVRVWKNQDKKTGSSWFNTEIVRLYKEDEEWRESTHFRANDLPLVAKAADLAFFWILELKHVRDEKDDDREDIE